MLYEVKEVANDSTFKPYQVILTIETREESLKFHSKVMTTLTDADSHSFFGAIFRAGHGDFEKSGSGKI